MKSVTFTKKQIKRIIAIALFVVIAVAVGITLAVTSVGSRAAKRLLPIYSVECAEKKIAVTFDVAWENSNTDQLIKILKDNDAKATFFVTGDWCDRYPDDVKKFFDAGHKIENHSDKHPHVLGMNVNDLIADTRECTRKIKMLTGEEPTLYRAPYGEYDDSLITTLDGMGMKVIQWDVDSVDWKKPSAEDIKKKVLKGVKPGSILLFHNDLENTTEALPEILKNLKEQGYKFVSVNDLIYKDNYTIDDNGKQIQSAAQNNSSAVEETAKITDEKIEAVMAQYSDKLSALGLSEQQIEQARTALKNGDVNALPKELQPYAQEVMARINENGNTSAATSTNTSTVTSNSNVSQADGVVAK